MKNKKWKQFEKLTEQCYMNMIGADKDGICWEKAFELLMEIVREERQKEPNWCQGVYMLDENTDYQYDISEWLEDCLDEIDMREEYEVLLCMCDTLLSLFSWPDYTGSDLKFRKSSVLAALGRNKEAVSFCCKWFEKEPENMDTIEGALIEPLAVGFHAANQGGARLGQKAVVMGAGCIGLMTLLALKAFGVTEVYVVDVMENRLAKAKELGAAGIINGKEQDAVEELMRATAGKGMDLCIDTAGSQITMNQCIGAAAKGAAVVFVGYSAQDQVSLDINNALNKELTFKTVFRYRNLYPLAIEAVSQGLNVKGVVTDFFKFDDVRKAMDLSVSNKAEIVKAVLSLR